MCVVVLFFYPMYDVMFKLQSPNMICTIMCGKMVSQWKIMENT